jgi:hypothetical protein
MSERDSFRTSSSSPGQRPRQSRPVERLAGAEDLDDRDATVARDVVDSVDRVEQL